MTRLFSALLLVVNLVAGSEIESKQIPTRAQMELFNQFDSLKHFKARLDKASFDGLRSWKFGWAMLEPLVDAAAKESEAQFAARLSPGQKALYFFWYLDGQVTNGGFVQFYSNGYRNYLSPIRDGLRLIEDEEMLSLVNRVDEEYLIREEQFQVAKKKDKWEPLDRDFDGFDSQYYKINSKTMELIERYARRNPNQFVVFIDSL